MFLRAVAVVLCADGLVSNCHSEPAQGNWRAGRLESAADFRACGSDLPDCVRQRLFADVVSWVGCRDGHGTHRHGSIGCRLGGTLSTEKMARVGIAVVGMHHSDVVSLVRSEAVISHG